MTATPHPIALGHPQPAAEPRGTITAQVGYIVRPDGKPYSYTSAYTGGPPRLSTEMDVRPVEVTDARPFTDRLSLDREGVELRRHRSSVTDFHDDAEVTAIYHREVERLLRAATGAEAVVVFDHTRRSDGGTGERTAVRSVHNDYTDASGRDRVRTLLGEAGIQRLASGRIAQINVWRPIRGPIKRAPLGVIDAGSVAPGDLVATDLIYPDRTGEIHHVAWNPDHRWLYFPEMTPDEVLLIKGWDSATDGRARFAPHAALDDPATPADAPPRESIELRALLVF